MFYKLKADDRYPDVWYNDDHRPDPYFTVICPKHPGHQHGKRDFSIPIGIDIKKPKMGDFVSTVYSDWLITDRVAEIFQKHKLTGYRLQQVTVCNKKLDFNLWELIVVGSAGKAHPDSEIRRIKSCEYCDTTAFTPIKKGVGIIVNEDTWDGSDFFATAEYWKFVLVTERVKKIIEDNELKGVLLVPSTALGE